MRCVFGDFAITGVATARNEGAAMTAAGFDPNRLDGQPQKAFAGPMGVGSLIENVSFFDKGAGNQGW